MAQSLSKLQLYQNKALAQGFSCEFRKIFKNNFFLEHLWVTGSILQQFLALFFAILYSWQLSRWEKLHPYISSLLQI